MFGLASVETLPLYIADKRIAQRQLSLAEIVIERAAFYEARLKNERVGTGDHGTIVTRLSHEYITLRIALVSLVVAQVALKIKDKLANQALGMAATSLGPREAHAC